MSFIFCHFLTFSLSLLGAQNLIFLGLNFATISLDSSYVKKSICWAHFGERGMGLTALGPLFLFFLFFLVFLSLFLLFIFEKSSHFFC